MRDVGNATCVFRLGKGDVEPGCVMSRGFPRTWSAGWRSSSPSIPLSRDMVIFIVSPVVSLVCSRAGDGTTTSTLLTQEIVNQGMRLVTAGCNPVELRQGILAASGMIIEEIKKLATPVRKNEVLCDKALVTTNTVTTVTTVVEIALLLFYQVPGRWEN